jgi:hypothetical protein
MFNRKFSIYHPTTYTAGCYNFIYSALKFSVSSPGILIAALVSLPALSVASKVNQQNSCMLLPYQPPFMGNDLQAKYIIDSNVARLDQVQVFLMSELKNDYADFDYLAHTYGRVNDVILLEDKGKQANTVEANLTSNLKVFTYKKRHQDTDNKLSIISALKKIPFNKVLVLAPSWRFFSLRDDFLFMEPKRLVEDVLQFLKYRNVPYARFFPKNNIRKKLIADSTLYAAIRKFPIGPMHTAGRVPLNVLRENIFRMACKKFPNVSYDYIDALLSKEYIVDLNNAAASLEQELLVDKQERIRVLKLIVDSHIKGITHDDVNEIMPDWYSNKLYKYTARDAFLQYFARHINQIKDEAFLKIQKLNGTKNLFSNEAYHLYFIMDSISVNIHIHAPDFLKLLLALPEVIAEDGQGNSLSEFVMNKNARELKKAFAMLANGKSIKDIEFDLQSYGEWGLNVKSTHTAMAIKTVVIILFVLLCVILIATALARAFAIEIRKITKKREVNEQLIKEINAGDLPAKDLLTVTEINTLKKIIEALPDDEIKKRFLHYLAYYIFYLDDMCAISHDKISDLDDPVSFESIEGNIIKTFDRASIVSWIESCTNSHPIKIATEPLTKTVMGDEKKKIFDIKRGYPTFITSMNKPARSHTVEAITEYDNQFSKKIK